MFEKMKNWNYCNLDKKDCDYFENVIYILISKLDNSSSLILSSSNKEPKFSPSTIISRKEIEMFENYFIEGIVINDSLFLFIFFIFS
jgi:hypothetical protein